MGANLAVGMGIGNQMAGAMMGSMMANQQPPAPGAAPGAAPQGQTAAGVGGSSSPASSGANIDDITATLEKLHGLVGKGILSQAEFDTKKAELLAKLG